MKIYTIKQIKRMDTRELYRITRETLGWNTTGPPSSLVEEGELLNKPVDIAECLAEFFKN